MGIWGIRACLWDYKVGLPFWKARREDLVKLSAHISWDAYIPLLGIPRKWSQQSVRRDGGHILALLFEWWEVGGNVIQMKTGGIGVRSGWQALQHSRSSPLLNFIFPVSVTGMRARQKAMMSSKGVHVHGENQKHHKSSVNGKARKRTTYVMQNNLFKFKLTCKNQQYTSKEHVETKSYETHLSGCSWDERRKGKNACMSGKPRAKSLWASDGRTPWTGKCI